MNNTHIAAQARRLAESHDSIAEVLLAGSPTFVSRNRGNVAKNTADLLRQCAQAIEAAELGKAECGNTPYDEGPFTLASPQAPALDAQGEAAIDLNSLHVALRHMGEIERRPARGVGDLQYHASQAANIIRDFLRAPSAPLPHAVGKPLSDSEILSGAKWFHDHSDFADGVRFAEKHHGIVTKETGA